MASIYIYFFLILLSFSPILRFGSSVPHYICLACVRKKKSTLETQHNFLFVRIYDIMYTAVYKVNDSLHSIMCFNNYTGFGYQSVPKKVLTIPNTLL